MPGIIGNVLENKKTVYGADTEKFDPTLGTVDKKQTTSGQLDDILKAGSPILERARAGAMETANSRGLLNSSIAVGAGEAAVLDKAIPIANADAGVFQTQALTNQAAKNTAGQFNAGSTNTANLNTAQAANQSQVATQAGEIESGLQTLKGQIETGLQQLKGTQATELANIEANYRQLIQTSQSAGSFYNDWTKSMAAILADTNTSAEQKTGAAQKMTQFLNSGLAVIGSIANVDLSGLLNFTGP